MKLTQGLGGTLLSVQALAKEVGALTLGSWRIWTKSIPQFLIRELVSRSNPQDRSKVDRLGQAVGDVVLAYLEDLGPIYGKAAQMLLSRIDNGQSRLIDVLKLSRIYGQWPAVSQSDIWQIIDAEVPKLRSELTLEATPLGVASIAQVYAATDAKGGEWVVKIVKPSARKRLLETLRAADVAIQGVDSLPGAAKSTVVRELRELVDGLRGEINLRREADTIERLREKIAGRRQTTLQIPAVWPELCSESVLVLERFRGTSLAKVISGEVVLSESDRRKLAAKTLQELLVQVFEIGLFHADPHAGNLMLLENGKIGIFDWGLAGELTEQDRKQIAEILKSVIARDLERLAQALVDMGAAAGIEVKIDAVQKELRKLAKSIQREREDPKKTLSLQQLVGGCLSSAEKLKIPLPSGLLMMSKALVTIEGLSRGIDPKVSVARIAAPILFRAARPGIRDVWNLAKSSLKFRR